MNPGPTLGQILRTFLAGPQARTLHLSPQQWKTVRALAACRTGALGGRLFHCARCQRAHFVAYSCRNRHCPQCQGARAVQWLEQQESALLPIPYFHLVFTLPHHLNPLIRQNRSALLGLLFQAASQTLLEFGRQRLKAQIGITAVLHTWSQTLFEHYHVHCIVTGGGLNAEAQKWIRTPADYLFPVRALSPMFRGKFLAGLKALHQTQALEFHGELQALTQAAPWDALWRACYQHAWVVYAKRPFAGPQQVLGYLSRYTHRVAISHRRLLHADAQQVTFTYKDYAANAQPKTMTLQLTEFVRRFCLHLLPERFVKIRHSGLLGNRQRRQRLSQARQLLGTTAGLATQPTEVTEPARVRLASACPFCHSQTLVLVREFRRGEPYAPPITDTS